MSDLLPNESGHTCIDCGKTSGLILAPYGWVCGRCASIRKRTNRYLP